MNKKPIKPLRTQLQMFVLENGVKCAYCHRKYDGVKRRLTLDHIIPKSKGGFITPDNTIVCCDVCNSKRGNEDMEDFIKKGGKKLKTNIKMYLDNMEKFYINNKKSYAKQLDWVRRLVEK